MISDGKVLQDEGDTCVGQITGKPISSMDGDLSFS